MIATFNLLNFIDYYTPIRPIDSFSFKTKTNNLKFMYLDNFYFSVKSWLEKLTQEAEIIQKRILQQESMFFSCIGTRTYYSDKDAYNMYSYSNFIRSNTDVCSQSYISNILNASSQHFKYHRISSRISNSYDAVILMSSKFTTICMYSRMPFCSYRKKNMKNDWNNIQTKRFSLRRTMLKPYLDNDKYLQDHKTQIDNYLHFFKSNKISIMKIFFYDVLFSNRIKNQMMLSSFVLSIKSKIALILLNTLPSSYREEAKEEFWNDSNNNCFSLRNAFEFSLGGIEYRNRKVINNIIFPVKRYVQNNWN